MKREPEVAYYRALFGLDFGVVASPPASGVTSATTPARRTATVTLDLPTRRPSPAS
ncbi:hypothetical protein [Streptomyces sp. NPDC101150]|uniref:hypothetical protein n=1 Tax=Streptomyces sp. NPDC101150 TaxID=3366114 RepID=UPI00380B2183